MSVNISTLPIVPLNKGHEIAYCHLSGILVVLLFLSPNAIPAMHDEPVDR